MEQKIKTWIENGDYVVFRLKSTGERIIGKVVNDIFTEAEHLYVLANPAEIVFNDNSFGLAPSDPFTKDNQLVVYKSDISRWGFMSKVLEQDYKRIFEKDSIIVPDKEIILAK